MQPANALLPGAGFSEEKLMEPNAAIAAYLRAVTLTPPTVEFVSLDDAYGRVLARSVEADDDYPSAARSAMDGFAIVAAEVPGRLRIAGEIAMGKAWPHPLAAGTALRIPTGGVVPGAADAVVPIEEARVRDEIVEIAEAVEPGENITPKGSDMRRGESLLVPGRWIGGAELGILATLGIEQVEVYRRPRIAVLSSGDELIAPSRRPQPGEVRDSNRHAIAGSLRGMGAVPRHYPTVPDTPGALESALRAALDECEGAMISGGSSVGERDLTPGALAALGAPGVLVHGLRVKPGKPTVLGAVGGKPVIGLPGNPASALMILQAVAAPIVAALVGAPVRDQVRDAVLAAPLRSRSGWTWYLPVTLQHEGATLVAHPLPLRSSAASLVARADGYVIMGETESEWNAGTSVRVHRFS